MKGEKFTGMSPGTGDCGDGGGGREAENAVGRRDFAADFWRGVRDGAGLCGGLGLVRLGFSWWALADCSALPEECHHATGREHAGSSIAAHLGCTNTRQWFRESSNSID